MRNISDYSYKYILELSLAFPNTMAPLDFESEDVERDIYKAQTLFNSRFEGRKEINVDKIIGQNLYLELLISFIPKNATREISVFSQILVQDFDFDKYSSKPGRLFKSEVIEYPEGVDKKNDYSISVPEGIVSQVAEKIMRDYDHEYPINKIPLRNSQLNTKSSVFIEMSNEILATDNIDELDNHIKQLENLLLLAKTKKNLIIINNL
ncbi:hypothetical protein G9F71_008630 [Clostridium sp. FP2]|uniref:hypothetical protein n=1 Tax=Clostridium sp. FP2 TaxID=2724481 RepID=UPI001CCD414D|nr:hypothetical protein [Clostridium sp. FP2]MBZ9622918.1 hypothetical protein [Clostridium sp. FP2]